MKILLVSELNMLKKRPTIKINTFPKEFPDFETGSRHDTLEFARYRQAMGFEPIELKAPAYTKATIKEIVDTVNKISHPHPNPILHGESELHALYEVALGLHDDTDDLGHVVQCGTYRGGSAAVLAMAIKNRGAKAPVITIDNFVYARNNETISETTDDVFLAHKHLLEILGLEKYIASIWHDNVSFLSNLWNLPIRLAAIDTIHTYKHTWNEINAISHHIVPGGWMAFHDYKPGDVPRVIHEWLPTLRRSYKLFESPVYAFIQLL